MQPTRTPINQPHTTVPAPALRVNLLKNASFNEPGGAPTIMVVPPGGFGFMPTAAPHWDVFNNQPNVTTTALLPSTKGAVGAGTMLQVCTDAVDSGLRQVIGAGFGTGPAKAVASAWVYVLSGRVGIGSGNGGGTSSHDAISTTTGQWELLTAPSPGSPVNQFVAYAVDFGGACFFIESASVYAA